MRHSDYRKLHEMLDSEFLGPKESHIRTFEQIQGIVEPLMQVMTPGFTPNAIIVCDQDEFNAAAESVTSRVAAYVYDKILPTEPKLAIPRNEYIETLIETNPLTNISLAQKGAGFSDSITNTAYVLQQQPHNAIITSIEEVCHLYLHDAHDSAHRYIHDPFHHEVIKLLHSYDDGKEDVGIIERIINPSEKTITHYGTTMQERIDKLGAAFGSIIAQVKSQLNTPEHRQALEAHALGYAQKI